MEYLLLYDTFVIGSLQVMPQSDNLPVPSLTDQPNDGDFFFVKLPKYLEGPHNIYDRSTTSSRMKHRSRSNSRDGHSHNHDTREGNSQKRGMMVRNWVSFRTVDFRI